MATTLISTWAEHDAALDRLLGLVERELCIFDHDLNALKLDQASRNARLREFLFANPKHRLRIAIQDSSQAITRYPRLIRLHGECAHNFSWTITSDNLAHLTDSLVIADDRHALVRFHHDHARCKLIEDDGDATTPYLRRFEDILAEGGTSFSSRPAGL